VTPLIVGVSGHRDLRPEDLPTLEAAVDECFARLAARYPATGPVVLTGLAIGADELVASRARAAGLPYIAVLPMPREAFADDFAGEEREALERSLAAAAAVIELPYLGAHSAATLRGNVAARAEQYESLAVFLATHSMIVLALWNGKKIEALGGTSRVIDLAVAPASDADAPATPRVYLYHIATPRLSDVGATFPIAAPALPPDDAVLLALDEIDGWNGQAAALERERDESPGAPFDATLCRRAFALADELAIRDQARTHRAIDSVYWLTLVASTALTIYGDLADLSPDYARPLAALSLVFLLATLGAAWTVYRLHVGENQNRFHDYRTLAEGLRVQQAFLDAGAGANAALYYGSKHRVEMDWIRRVVSAAFVLSSAAPGGANRAGPTVENLLAVDRSWIAAQRDYLTRAAARNERASQRSNRIALVWLRVSIAAGVLVACDGAVRLTTGVGIGSVFHLSDSVFKAVSLSLLGWPASLAALAKGRSTLRGYGQTARRFHAARKLFDATSLRLHRLLETPTPANVDRGADVIVELGREALAENGDWLLAQRDRPLEIIWAG
jgi:hypothetical protein